MKTDILEDFHISISVSLNFEIFERTFEIPRKFLKVRVKVKSLVCLPQH